MVSFQATDQPTFLDRNSCALTHFTRGGYGRRMGRPGPSRGVAKPSMFPSVAALAEEPWPAHEPPFISLRGRPFEDRGRRKR